jgi:hypothetical protein
LQVIPGFKGQYRFQKLTMFTARRCRASHSSPASVARTSIPWKWRTSSRSHPAVSQCAVIGIPSERWGETVHAFVIPNPGSNVNAAEKMAAHPSRSR